jgi:hypothetical protein
MAPAGRSSLPPAGPPAAFPLRSQS